MSNFRYPAYLIFHHNLLYSSIPERHYRYIIDKVYHQLLKLSMEGIKLGMEFNGWTLEKIYQISPSFIEELKQAISESKIEVIASSYSQAIFPLIPYQVNYKNVRLGIEAFKSILEIKPKLFLLNEMVYSTGTVKLLKELGFSYFVFDWVNATKGNGWGKRIRPWEVVKNEGLDILWADTYMTQKFQRCVWKDIDFEDYVEFLNKKISEKPFAIPIYVGDAEVFEYIPGSLNFTKQGRDFKRLKDLLKIIRENFPIEFILPSSIKKERDIEVCIATTEYPIRTKKQDKYNVTRWAVSGRESAKMNTQCYSLFKKIRKSKNKDLWKNLCILWGSDFRTNTTDEKFLLFRNLMGHSLLTANKEPPEKPQNQQAKCIKANCYEKGRYIIIDTPYHKAILIKNKGLALKEMTFKKKYPKPLIGTIEHGYYNDISLGADFFSFHLLAATNKGEKITDISKTVEVSCKTEDGFFKVSNSIPMELPFVSLFKEYWFSDVVRIVYKLYFKDLYPMTVRLGIVTFIPNSFDRNTLFYSTHNGGREEEVFYLSGKRVNLDQPVNYIVTTKGCLGSTEEKFVIGDKEKHITILTDKSLLYSIPFIRYEEIEDSFFLRIYHSICERDEVSNAFFKGYNEIFFELR